jgi:hypothetical protein
MIVDWMLRFPKGLVRSQDDRFARRIGEHQEQFLGRKAGFSSGWSGHDDAVEVLDVPESFQGVDGCAAAFDAGVDGEACDEAGRCPMQAILKLTVYLT